MPRHRNIAESQISAKKKLPIASVRGGGLGRDRRENWQILAESGKIKASHVT
jgi:hypothetical protein